jgi:hypothetical protein
MTTETAPEIDSPLLRTPLFVARTEILDVVQRHLWADQNVCLYGERGIGKTALMEEIARWLREEKPEVRLLQIVYQTPFTDVLLALVRELHRLGLFAFSSIVDDSVVYEDREDVVERAQALPLEQLHAAVIHSLTRERFLLVLDNVNSVSGTDRPWLDEIITATLCVLATRNPEAEHVKPLLTTFALVAVPPLSRQESYALIEALMFDHPILGGDRLRYQAQVHETSGGHPGAIRDVLWEDAQALREAEVAQPPQKVLRALSWAQWVRPLAGLAVALLCFAVGFAASVWLPHGMSSTALPQPGDTQALQELRTQLEHLQAEQERLNMEHTRLQRQLTEEVAALGKKIDQLRFAFGRYKRGSKGAAVERIQQQLKELGYYAGEVTGDYDRMTMRAVRTFQDLQGLPVNGVVGTETWERLFAETVASSQ